MKTIGVIGCGNMGIALLRGILRARLIAPRRVFAADSDPAKRAAAARSLRVRAADNSAAARCEVVILAVKPQQMEQLLAEIRPRLTPRTLLISVAAGIPAAWIEARAGARVPVIRVMPNTPALVGAGISALSAGKRAEPKHLVQAERILRSVGEVVRVPEKWMDAVTAVSGSGPAYFFFLMEQMIEAGEFLGLSAGVARRLVLQTAAGAAKLALESDEEPAQLRARVTSKRGTTEAALEAFARARAGEGIRAGIRAAAARSKQLAQERGR